MAVVLARAEETHEGLGLVASDDQPFSQFLLHIPVTVPIKLKMETAVQE